MSCIKVETIKTSSHFKTFDDFIDWLMGWIPHSVKLPHDQALEFSKDFAKELYRQQNKDVSESFTLTFPFLHIEACSKKNDLWDGNYYNKNSRMQQQVSLEVIDRIEFKGDERILDIGCGDGKITAAIAAKVPQGDVVGLDLSQSMIKTAQEKFSDVKNLSFSRADATCFNFDQKFDYVFSFFTIHWIQDQLSVLKNIKNVLKPGGNAYIVVATNYESDISEAVARLKNKGFWQQAIETRARLFHIKMAPVFESLLKQAGLESKIEIPKCSYLFDSFDELVSWLQGFLPLAAKLNKTEGLKFCNDVAQEIYDGKNISITEPIVLSYHILDIKAS